MKYFCSGVYSLFRNMRLTLEKNRRSSGIPPGAHFTVRLSRILKSHLFFPAPVQAMMASRCSCRSSAGPAALTRASLTCGSEAISCLAACLLSHGATGCHVPAPSPSCARCLSSFCFCGYLPPPELRGIRAVVQCRRSTLWVRGDTRAFHAVLQSMATFFFSVFCCFSVLLTQNSSDEIVHFSCFPRL